MLPGTTRNDCEPPAQAEKKGMTLDLAAFVLDVKGPLRPFILMLVVRLDVMVVGGCCPCLCVLLLLACSCIALAFVVALVLAIAHAVALVPALVLLLCRHGWACCSCGAAIAFQRLASSMLHVWCGCCCC